jgi:hypothetical protein
MMNQKLGLETLAVESFVTGTGAESLPVFEAGATRNCDTRQTACTVGP